MKYAPVFVIYGSLQSAAITARFLVHVCFVVGLVPIAMEFYKGKGHHVVFSRSEERKN